MFPRAGTIRDVPDVAAFVDEVVAELSSWPGVRIEHRPDRRTVVVRYEHAELGLLERERGLAELPTLGTERDELVEHGDAEPADAALGSSGVSHELRGPSDVTAVLELFDRRYRDVRGEDYPYSSTDPAA